MDISTILFYLVALILIYVIGRILLVPIKILTKIFLNAVVGLIVLFLFNIVGGLLNLSIDISFLNAIVVGFLGVPGVILLLALKIIF